MRLKIVAGNWKMNPDAGAARRLAEAVWGAYAPNDGERVILFPPAVYLGKFTHLLPQIEHWHWGAQYCSAQDNGAYTGEISASMLKSLGIQYVLVGHSERRQLFGETGALLAKTVSKVLEQGMSVVFCCGEPLHIREQGTHLEFIADQLKESLWHLPAELLQDVVIAYEPVWAIGTGIHASAQQAQEAHAFIRKIIHGKYGPAISDNMSIIYGGSCKPDNARELFSCPDIDGGLIGGASLIAEDFLGIIEALKNE